MTEPDDRIAALFRAAADDADAPPPGFDHGGVVATSRRIRARRRSAVLGGAVALLVVAGVGAAVALPRGADQETASAAAPAQELTPYAEPPYAEPSYAAPEAAGPRVADPGAQAQAAVAPPLGPSVGDCAPRQDPALRVLVEEVLPEVVGAPEAATTQECRPAGERGLSVEVADADAAGLLTVLYLPPGQDVGPTDGAFARQPTASGGTVVVSASGSGGAAPFEDRLGDVAAYLAPRL